MPAIPPKKVTSPTPLKYCWDCQQSKPFDQFYPKKNGKLYSYCKDCNSQQCKSLHRKRRGDKFREPRQEAPEGFWQCRRCNETKPVTEFNKNKSHRTGHDNYCRSCCKKYTRMQWLRSKYKITVPEYEALLLKQNGVCAGCKKSETAKHMGKNPKLSVDHDHVTGAVRGLLCYSCNHYVGYIERGGDELLEALLTYLSKHSLS